jgi:6-pyruvoyltetrahydropterin/6-carboxytetrahydropterin synthase
MIQLRRTVRMCINHPVDFGRVPDTQAERTNTFAAWPPMRGLGAYYELDVLCEGEPDPLTGYFINIKHIDVEARKHALPVILAAFQDPRGAGTRLGELMQKMHRAIDPALGSSVTSLTLKLSPTYALQIRKQAMGYVVMRQQYEFSAAHRLHVPSYSQERNQEIFGKCNNENGHGHNYRVEVAVRVPIEETGRVLMPEDLDKLVDEIVVQKLDHKNLNLDVPEFLNLNSSVEHIVKVVFDMLEKPVRGLGAELEEVSVWETGKTMCTFKAGTAC